MGDGLKGRAVLYLDDSTLEDETMIGEVEVGAAVPDGWVRYTDDDGGSELYPRERVRVIVFVKQKGGG